MTMTQTAPRLAQLMTMEDYLAYDDGTDTRDELVDGVLVEMPLESQFNAAILRRRIARFNQPSLQILTLALLKFSPSDNQKAANFLDSARQ